MLAHLLYGAGMEVHARSPRPVIRFAREASDEELLGDAARV